MLLHTSVNNYFSVAFTDMFPSLDPAYAGHAFLVSSATAAAVSFARATHSAIVTPSIGTKGTTSTAPRRGCRGWPR